MGFFDEVGLGVRSSGDLGVGVGNGSASARGIKVPGVERAHDTVPLDCAPNAQMGSQVGAVGVQCPNHTVVAAKHHQIALLEAHIANGTNRQIDAVAELEPAIGVHWRELEYTQCAWRGRQNHTCA